jgi:hypothetical protein
VPPVCRRHWVRGGLLHRVGGARVKYVIVSFSRLVIMALNIKPLTLRDSLLPDCQTAGLPDAGPLPALHYL